MVNIQTALNFTIVFATVPQSLMCLIIYLKTALQLIFQQRDWTDVLIEYKEDVIQLLPVQLLFYWFSYLLILM
jgi:hypothetical protein